jgi:hypothetical protein
MQPRNHWGSPQTSPAPTHTCTPTHMYTMFKHKRAHQIHTHTHTLPHMPPAATWTPTRLGQLVLVVLRGGQPEEGVAENLLRGGAGPVRLALNAVQDEVLHALDAHVVQGRGGDALGFVVGAGQTGSRCYHHWQHHSRRGAGMLSAQTRTRQQVTTRALRIAPRPTHLGQLAVYLGQVGTLLIGDCTGDHLKDGETEGVHIHRLIVLSVEHFEGHEVRGA